MTKWKGCVLIIHATASALAFPSSGVHRDKIFMAPTVTMDIVMALREEKTTNKVKDGMNPIVMERAVMTRQLE